MTKLSIVLCLLLACFVACSSEPEIPEDFPWDLEAEIVKYSTDSTHVFRIIQPGEPEWEDYVAMSEHEDYRSFLDGREGYALTYDPEWRTHVRGYREAAPVEMELLDAHDSMEALARAVLAGLGENDYHRLRDLMINFDEYERICWPSFPQSRPYLNVPVDEAWGFQHATSGGGIRDGLREYGAKSLRLEEVRHGDVEDYRNFRILNEVVIAAWDVHSQERVELDFLDSIIEKDGVYKGFLFKD